jgi:phosphoglycerol transferase
MTVRALGAVGTPVGEVAGRLGWVRSVPVPLAQAALIGVVLFVVLQGWDRDFRVPLTFSNDALFYLAQSKSTVDNGWWWWNPRLGAPFGLDELGYPSNTNVDQAVVWMVSRVVSNPLAATNLAWALLVILSGLSATWAMRMLSLGRLAAVALGTLFAFTPYALYRHIDHFGLVIYLVPFAAAASLLLASGLPHRRWKRSDFAIVLIGCTLLGLNYIYYAFFGCFCLAAGALIGYARTRDLQLFASAALCVAVIGGSTAINLAPSLYSWHLRGKPTVLRDKTPAEAETFGLNLRHVISPVYPNAIPPLHRWVQREAVSFPNDNENWSNRLGLIGTVGFLGLLVLLFIPDTAGIGAAPTVRGASRLVAAMLLLATVGGFGTLFNLFVVPDIRAYNRILPFIAFSSLFALGYGVDRLCRTQLRRAAAALAVLAVGLADQSQALTSVNLNHDSIRSEIAGLESLVHSLERTLPDRAAVFQLPLRTYMSESLVGRMRQYDHFKPYLVSESLRFSYPALSNEQVAWQQAVARLDAGHLAPQLAGAGFDAVLVDRNGYQDNGEAIVAALRSAPGIQVIAETQRFTAFDLRAVETSPANALSRPVPLTLSLPLCTGGPFITIDQIGATRAPFTSAGARVARADEFKVSGWAIDVLHRAPAAGVDVAVDRLLFPSTYGGARRDVVQYFQRPEYEESGFTASISAARLDPGEHLLSLRVVARDGSCFYQPPGIRLLVAP